MRLGALLDGRVLTVGKCLELETLEDLLLYGLVGDGSVDASAVLCFNQAREQLRVRPEFGLSDKLAKVNSPRQGLQARNVTSCRRAVIFLRLATITAAKVGANSGEELFDVELLDLVVDNDIVLV